jgi:hypothetical protein
VNDFLYLLDWLAGHDWAYQRMREATREAFTSPEPTPK